MASLADIAKVAQGVGKFFGANVGALNAITSADERRRRGPVEGSIKHAVQNTPLIGPAAGFLWDKGWPKGGGGDEQAQTTPLAGLGGTMGSEGGQTSLSSLLGGPVAPVPIGTSSEYMNALRSGTQGQQERLAALFQGGLEEVARREAQAEGLRQALPGQLNTITRDEERALTASQAQAAQAVNQAGPVALSDIGLTGTEGAAPFLGAMSAINASRQSDIPYLEAASSSHFGGQRTALNMAMAQAQVEAEENERNRLAQLAATQMEIQSRAALQAQELEMQRRMATAELEGTLPQQFAPYAVNPGYGVYLQNQGAGRLTGNYPKAWNTVSNMWKSGVEPAENLASLQKWVDSGRPGRERADRAKLASLVASQYAPIEQAQ